MENKPKQLTITKLEPGLFKVIIQDEYKILESIIITEAALINDITIYLSNLRMAYE